MTTEDFSSIPDWPTGGFPGVRTNPDTLLPHIVNEEAMQSALAESSDPADRIMALMLEGHPGEAAHHLDRAGDRSCLMHIGGGLSRQRAGVRAIHLAQVLASTEEHAT